MYLLIESGETKKKGRGLMCVNLIASLLNKKTKQKNSGET